MCGPSFSVSASITRNVVSLNPNALPHSHNTQQAGVLLNVSPKDIGPGLEVGPPNINITFKNNIVSLRMPIAPREDPPRTLLVEARVLPGTQPAGGSPLPDNLPAGATCAARRHRNRHRRRLSVSAVAAGADADTVAGGGRAAEQQLRRALLQAPHSSGTSFAAAALNAPGEQVRARRINGL